MSYSNMGLQTICQSPTKTTTGGLMLPIFGSDIWTPAFLLGGAGGAYFGYMKDHSISHSVGYGALGAFGSIALLYAGFVVKARKVF